MYTLFSLRFGKIKIVFRNKRVDFFKRGTGDDNYYCREINYLCLLFGHLWLDEKTHYKCDRCNQCLLK